MGPPQLSNFEAPCINVDGMRSLHGSHNPINSIVTHSIIAAAVTATTTAALFVLFLLVPVQRDEIGCGEVVILFELVGKETTPASTRCPGCSRPGC